MIVPGLEARAGVPPTADGALPVVVWTWSAPPLSPGAKRPVGRAASESGQGFEAAVGGGPPSLKLPRTPGSGCQLPGSSRPRRKRDRGGACLRRGRLRGADAAAAVALLALPWLLYGSALELWWTYDDLFQLRFASEHGPAEYLIDPDTQDRLPNKVLPGRPCATLSDLPPRWQSSGVSPGTSSTSRPKRAPASRAPRPARRSRTPCRPGLPRGHGTSSGVGLKIVSWGAERSSSGRPFE